MPVRQWDTIAREKSMRRAIIRLSIYLALLLAWQLVWFFVLGSESLCNFGRCLIHRDLALLYYIVNIGSVVAIWVWRERLYIPQRFEIPLYILVFLQALWAVQSFEEEANNHIPTDQIAIDTVFMTAALALSLITAAVWLLSSSKGTT